MTLISFDEKCNACSLCVAVCPEHVLALASGDATPTVAHADACITCGQCVAVCNHDAIVHHRMEMNQFLPAVRQRDLDPDLMERFLRSKRSIRHFRDKPVPRAVIERLLRVANQAPSDNNRQEREFLVVTDPQKLQELERLTVRYYEQLLTFMRPWVRRCLSLFAPGLMAELEKVVPDFEGLIARAQQGEQGVFRGAPCAIFMHAPRGNTMGKDNCIVAQDYLMLQAAAMGLGTCIIGYATGAHSALARSLGIPKDHQLHVAITLGYPKYRFARTVDRPAPRVTWQEAGGQHG